MVTSPCPRCKEEERMTGSMNLLSRQGHTVVAEWDTEDATTVERANEEFDRIVAFNLAYTVDPVTKKSEQLHKFDPEVETIIFHAPLVGG